MHYLASVFDILHVTLLNPAAHSRIFYKMAQAQARAGYKVAVIGLAQQVLPHTQDGVHIIPLGPHSRQVFGYLGRLRLAARLLWLLWRHPARAVQAHTPEALPGLLLLRLLRRFALVYDMHEDYWQNLRADGRYMQALLARGAERLARPRLAQVLYAEQCYVNVLDMPTGRFQVIENKHSNTAILPRIDLPPAWLGLPLLVYSGSISRAWGVFRALDLWEELNKSAPVALAIVGYCYNRKLLHHVERRLQRSPYKDLGRLVGGAHYVPHPTVLAWQQQATAVLALYDPAPHIRDKVPTKFFEAMGQRRPLLFTQSPHWTALNKRYHFGVPLPHNNTRFAAIRTWQHIQAHFTTCYDIPLAPEHFLWHHEAERMLAFYHQLLG